MSSPNLPPIPQIPPIPDIPAIPDDQQPAAKKRAWWFWGLIGCAGLLVVGTFVLAVVAAIAIPAIMKAMDNNRQQVTTVNQPVQPPFGQAPQQTPQAGAFPANLTGAGQAVAPTAPTGQAAGQGVSNAWPSDPSGQPINAPAWIPYYPNANGANRLKETVDNRGVRRGGLSFSTADSDQAVIAFYRERLTALGMQGKEWFEQETNSRMYEARSADNSRSLTVGASTISGITIVGFGYQSAN